MLCSSRVFRGSDDAWAIESGRSSPIRGRSIIHNERPGGISTHNACSILGPFQLVHLAEFPLPPYLGMLELQIVPERHFPRQLCETH